MIRGLFFQRSMLVMLILSLLFSAVPLLLNFLDKSNITLTLILAWYTLWTTIVLFLVALWLNRKQDHWLRVMAQTWVGLSLWFWAQVVLALLVEVHLIFRILALPATLAGGMEPFLAGGLLFLLGGVAFWFLAARVPHAHPRPMWSRVAQGLLLVLVFLLPLFAFWMTRLGAGQTPQATVPTQEQTFRTISDVYGLGARRPGSPPALEAVAYLESRLQDAGFTDIQTEWTAFDYWEATEWGLNISPGASDPWAAEAFYVPYSGPTTAAGVTAEVVYVGDIAAPEWPDVAGKIVLVDIPAVDIYWDQLSLFSYLAYDPLKNTAEIEHPFPIGWCRKFTAFYPEAESRQPAGIIGILRDYPEMDEFTYYCPFDGELRDIPGLYIPAADGDKLKADLEQAEVTATLVLEADISPDGGNCANVYTILPGRSDETIIVHSHYDSPFASAVEDSSGTSMVLALAQYYVQLPMEQRARTMIFLFTGSHFVGGPGNYAFIDQHEDDILSQTLFDVAIEHIADDYNPPEPPTGQPEPRGVFVTENPVVISQYAAAVTGAQAQRTLIFPTGTPLGLPSDARYFSTYTGIVSLISGPSWLLDAGDTLDLVAEAELVPLTRMYINFIARLDATPAWLLQFNLAWVTIGILALLFSPLAAGILAWRKGAASDQTEPPSG